MKRADFSSMGSRMTVLLDSSAASTGIALEQVPAWFEEWEQCLSRFRTGSELSGVNLSGGKPTQVSQTLWEVFHAARQMEAWTDGLVSPTVLDAVLEAGYDRSFEHLSMVAESLHQETGEVRGRVDPDSRRPFLSDQISWDDSTGSLALPEGVHLDLGGFGKGWAAWEAVTRLSQVGPCVVDAGGDVAISGPQAGGEPWPVGVRDPFHPKDHLAVLGLEACGVATSGTDYHRWQKDGRWQHHIIDPRSGQPAITDVLTATVVAPDTIMAEAAAKYILISGSQTGFDWLDSYPDLAGLVVLQSGEVVTSTRINQYLLREP